MEVYKSIAAVAGELATKGISKDSRNQAQGFNFRGIDAVYNALAPLLVKHSLCILPRCIERNCVERVNHKGTALFYVTVKCEFDLVSAIDGSKHTVVTFGEAMDSGDKATNKAMSSAYKYAAFQAFCIPTEETSVDADAESHEVQSDKLMDLIACLDAAETLEELKTVFASAWKESKGHESIKKHYDSLKGKLA
jgi:hypothetical protein